MPKLSLGCGNEPQPKEKGWINLDINMQPGVDVVHNLEVYPYPFKDNTFDYILAEFIIEHLNDFSKVLKELHRILKPEGVVEISVPYDISYSTWSNYQHKRGFNLKTFLPFAKNTEHKSGQSYGVAWFSKMEQKLWFPKGLHIFSWLFDIIFNRMQKVYEETCLRTLIPSYSIKVRLTK